MTCSPSGGARTDWAMTVPGEARQVIQAELKELLEAGTLDEDAVVTVGGQSITAGDLLVVLDIEAELRRIQETYFPEGGVDLSAEQAEALYSLYSQLLANGGFTLYNTNAADDLTADDFHSGIDQTVTISASGVDNAQMNSAYTVTVTLNEAQPNEDVIFSWRTFSGSVNAGGSGTVIIPAGQTEATFTASVGGAADRLDDGGQGAFVVQVYDVKNALFADGKDSWTKAVRVQGQDALKYYEEQSATASKTDSNGIVAAADHSSTRNWLKGNATTGQILTGTTDPFSQDTFNNWNKNGMSDKNHAVLEHTFTVEGLSTGMYSITFKLDATTATVPKDARDFFSEIGMSIAAIQQTALMGYRIVWTSPTASSFDGVLGDLSVTLNQNETSDTVPAYNDTINSGYAYDSDGNLPLSLKLGLIMKAFGFNCGNNMAYLYLPARRAGCSLYPNRPGEHHPGDPCLLRPGGVLHLRPGGPHHGGLWIPGDSGCR